MPDAQETAETARDRPMPGPGRDDAPPQPVPGSDRPEAPGAPDDSAAGPDGTGAPDSVGEPTGGAVAQQSREEPEREQEYVARDELDFDPDDGLYTGTAVDGTTKIPGPHDLVDDVEPGDEDEEKIADE